MNLENIGKDCPCYEVDCSDIMFDIGEFCGLPPNNGKLTIQVNGSTVGDFSANQQEDTTIDIQTVTQQDIDNAVSSEATIRERADRDLQANIDGERLAREQADRTLQGQIDAIASKSDVVDVVGTYAELQAYDTSKLNDNDVVKVLDDSTHNDSMTYYRWNKTAQTWSYIGQESPYYSKSQTDSLLATKQDNLTAGTGITLNGSTISADTTVLAEKSELNNYAEKANTYTKPEVDNLVEPKLSVEVVEQLPVQGEQNKLYLTEKAHTTQTATGNPITITLSEDAGQVESFQLDGDTFQQSYTGKNLFEYIPTAQESQGLISTIDSNGVVTVTGTGTARWSDISQYSDDASPSGAYTITVSTTGTGTLPRNIALRIADDNNTNLQTVTVGMNESVTETLVAHTKWRVFLATDADVVYNFKIKIQVEAGSTASDFEPFVGGIASPNPSYPQPIQVVTGEQTVSINGTDYPISLGSIELCKLGAYQDRIYKDGSDWKIHKETGKFVFTTEITRIDGMSKNGSLGFVINTYNNPLPNKHIPLVGACSHFGVEESTTTWTGIRRTGMNSTGALWFQTGDSERPDSRTITQFFDWLASSGVTYDYALATPTDTEITDSTLIAQLNAIASASLETGTNTLTNSATGSNLAGDMEVDYFGYDPTNRYDKWLWLDINNAYEKLGS